MWCGVVWCGVGPIGATDHGRFGHQLAPVLKQLELNVKPLKTLSTATLRRKVHGLELMVRYHRNWDRLSGNDGFVVHDWRLNIPVTEPLDEDEVRDYLIDALTE